MSGLRPYFRTALALNQPITLPARTPGQNREWHGYQAVPDPTIGGHGPPHIKDKALPPDTTAGGRWTPRKEWKQQLCSWEGEGDQACCQSKVRTTTNVAALVARPRMHTSANAPTPLTLVALHLFWLLPVGQFDHLSTLSLHNRVRSSRPSTLRKGLP